jgi:hypothetical protein
MIHYSKRSEIFTIIPSGSPSPYPISAMCGNSPFLAGVPPIISPVGQVLFKPSTNFSYSWHSINSS